MNSGESPRAAPADRFDPSPDLIRVWRVQLDGPLPELANFEKILSPEEIARAGRCHFERDRRRFIVTRGVLRLILGRCLQERPEQVAFLYGAFGKPALKNRETALQFNVSHSHAIALVAVALTREVGVDVEYLRPLADADQLVTANFSARESNAWRSLAPAQQEAAFFAGWTRKEAYLKAQGGGLSISLQSFSVSLRPAEPAALLEVNGDSTAARRWGMVDLPVGPGYTGALVASGIGWRFDCVDWVADA